MASGRHKTRSGAWAVATFGGPQLTPRHCIRLLEEVAELCLAAGATPREIVSCLKFGHDQRAFERRAELEKVPEEIADCQIVLYTLAHRVGIDLEAAVQAKMRTNRGRKWSLNGDGTGYHV